MIFPDVLKSRLNEMGFPFLTGDDNKNGRNLKKSKPSLVVVVLPVVMGSAVLVTILYCLWRMRIVKKG